MLLLPAYRAFLFLVLGFVLAGCAGGYSPDRSPSEGGPHVEVPEEARAYTTSTGSDGVRGGESAREAEALLRAELAVRGDDAEPDSVLADTAAWALRAAYAKQALSSASTTSAAHQFGFAGMTLGWIAGAVGEEKTRLSLKDLIAQVPTNTRINRYGIVAGRGRDVVIILGMVETSLADFPRSLAPGGSLRIKGDVSERFERASVFATSPDGDVRELPMTARAIDASLEFPATGVYKLEVMGYGATGPVVLVNVPIHVGVEAAPEATITSEVDPELTAEQAEAALLALLNEERKKRGLAPVAADAELRAVALAHSVDMAEHGFFGHVSPSTGTPENRVTKAHLRVSKVGECVALELTPAGAHRGLMDSPAHRAAMLEPSFTHAGIGVAFVESGRSQRRLAATLLLGRRPPPEDARLTTAETLEAIQGFRRARGLPALEVDPVLTAVAGAGGRALSKGQPPSLALAAAGREMQAQVNRTRVNRSSCQLYLEVLDKYQLAEIPLLKRPDIVAIGVGTAQLEDASGPKLGIVLMADAGPRKTVTCN